MSNSKKMSKIFAIMGPSCVGKATISKLAVTISPNLIMPVGVTTRKRRKHEINWIDYGFISTADFYLLLLDKELIVSTSYKGNFYGFYKRDIFSLLDINKNLILIVTPEGRQQLKKVYGDRVISIFINPHTRNRLRDLIKKRKGDNAFLDRKEDIFGKFVARDYTISNRNLESSVDKLAYIVKCKGF